MALVTAREWGVTPLTMLLGDDSPKSTSWTSARNRLLAMALQHHESQVCRGCGQPLHESAGDDPPDYSVEDYQCKGCELLAEAGTPEDKPGTHWYLDVKRRQRTATQRNPA